MTYDKDENYCTMSPDTILGVKINYACYLHDRQYRNEVKERKSRLEADKQLREGIYRALEVKNKFLAYIISTLYYCAVRIFASKNWE